MARPEFALWILLAAASASPSAHAAGVVSARSPLQVTSPPSVDLARERALLDASSTALAASDLVEARAKAKEAVESLLARPPSDQDASWLALLEKAGRAAFAAQDHALVKRASEKEVEVLARTRSPDDRDLRFARLRVANSARFLGDLAEARAIQEDVLAGYARTHPDDHGDVQIVREQLAGTLQALGDDAGARALFEKILEVQSRSLPEDDPRILISRRNLASTLYRLGDLAGAGAILESVLALYTRTLPEDHPDVQAVRQSLAAALSDAGDHARARELQEIVLAVRERTLPDSHPQVQTARLDLAGSLSSLGELDRALALQRKAFDVVSRTLPDDHAIVQLARTELAISLREVGELTGARALFEQVLSVYARTLPEHHRTVQVVRGNLALVLRGLGDLAGARELQEDVLETRSRLLPDDHSHVQAARLDLAATLHWLGDFAGAGALEEKILEVASRTLPDDHRDLQLVRGNHANTLRALGDLKGALALEEKVLEVRSRLLPDDHPELQLARANLAATRLKLGDLNGARDLQEQVLRGLAETLPADHHELQRARRNLARTLASIGSRGPGTGTGGAADSEPGRETRRRFGELTRDLAGALRHACSKAILESSSREAEERVACLAENIGFLLSFTGGMGVFDRESAWDEEAFLTSETARGAALSSARLARKASSSPEYEVLRRRVRESSAELSKLAASEVRAEEIAAARGSLDRAERDLVAAAKRLYGTDTDELEPTFAALAARVRPGEAWLAFRRYERRSVERGEDPPERSTESLCAFVLRAAEGPVPARVERVELGPIAPIEVAVDRWRVAIGTTSGRGIGAAPERPSAAEDAAGAGEDLRALLIDPVAVSLSGVERVILAPDDVLHAVPLDALPAGAGQGRPPGELLGSRLRIEVRSTFVELLAETGAPPSRRDLVALGGAAFGDDPDEAARESAQGVAESPRPAERSGCLRGGPWEAGFQPLPATGEEVLGIERRFAEAFGDRAPSSVVTRHQASRESLLALAPRARFLHLATHGWFAQASIRSFHVSEPLDVHSGLGRRTSGEGLVLGMSPMLLCGLALAGANRPADATGRIPGLITAEDLATLDLEGCELAVLSACDTNVGVRRAGQGVASLQKALHMAGARSVITSLWKVPDEATKDLMLDFYRRLWVEKKPKWQALWEAKMRIRDAKDDAGRPRYSTRDWAAWVLTGDPN